MEEGNGFSLSTLGEGVPQVTYPPPWPGQGRGKWYPKVPTPQPRYLPPWPGQDGGIPRYLPPGQGTYPPSSQVRTGGIPRYLPPSQGTFPPPPQDRTAYGVLDMLRSVCLLRSRRRTFLFIKELHNGPTPP